MKVNLKKTLIVCCSIGILVISGSPLPAYVLQGRHVLDLMVKKLGVSKKSLLVSEKTEIYRLQTTGAHPNPWAVESTQLPANTEGGFISEDRSFEISGEVLARETLEFEGTLRYLFSRAFRSDTKSAYSERIHIAVGGRSLTIVDGQIEPSAVQRFDLYKDILLYRSRKLLAHRLIQLGVDVSLSSLGRFEGQLAFVIGANSPDDAVNQLWVDKETFLPMRLMIKDASGVADSGAVEMRYLTWWKVGKTHYPSRIEFYQDDRLVRVSQAKSFKENAKFSSDLFDIEHQKLLYPEVQAPGAVSETSEESSEVQKTIEEFNRIFE